MKKIFAHTIPVAMLCLICSACTNKNSATVNGQFFGYSNQPIVVQKVHPGQNNFVIDTLSTDSEGKFTFSVSFENPTPMFINVRTKNSYVPLLIAPAETITLSSVGNIYNNYTVKGSQGSQTLRELNSITTSKIKTLDSLSIIFANATSEKHSQEIGQQYAQQYIKLKQEVIRFVITNPTSLASIVPLYQPIFDGKYIFDEPSDIVYYSTVADSLEKYYPDSPYVTSLLSDVQRSKDIFALDSTIQANLDQITVDLPEIVLKDAEGKVQKLSSLLGNKIVLLDFTLLAEPEQRVRNRELAKIYKSYADQGFEIFQISLDENRAQWLTAVVDARLEWICVNDPNGANSVAVRSYNVQQLPMNFLIDRDSKIAYKNLNSAKELEKAISELL